MGKGQKIRLQKAALRTQLRYCGLHGVSLVVAVILNATLGGSGGDEDVLGNESTKILGNSVLTNANADGNEGTDTETAEDFFASAVINRQRVRDEAMETLRQVADSPDAMQETKNQALKSIEDMVAEMNSEVNIETLVKAKGFEECVAVISDEKCSIIVKSEGLTASRSRRFSTLLSANRSWRQTISKSSKRSAAYRESIKRW